MRVIPVIDLMNGLVVRGVAGQRAEYKPVKSQIATDARPEAVAKVFVEHFGFKTVYVADLDAIMLGRPDVDAWKKIASAGLQIWLDAGVGSEAIARSVMKQLLGTEVEARLVVGLESLESMEELASIREACHERPPLFSLDLKDGRPLVRNEACQNAGPLELVAMAVAAGMQDFIILDLADVGVGSGTRTLELCREVRKEQEVRTLIAGGGVRGIDDLQKLARAGCDAALVASALHDGKLTAEELSTLTPALSQRERESGQAGRLSY